MSDTTCCIAFAGTDLIAMGAPGDVARAVHARVSEPDHAPICVLDAATSAPVDFVMHGTADEVAAMADEQMAARAEAAGKATRGRPRLGVVAREVTLLPRHWDWLSAQPGGASVTLRKLVDAARKQNGANDRVRRTQDVTYRFLHAVAGDVAGYEEVSRALYAWDLARLDTLLAGWPTDVVAHVRRLLAGAEDDAS